MCHKWPKHQAETRTVGRKHQLSKKHRGWLNPSWNMWWCEQQRGWKERLQKLRIKSRMSQWSSVMDIKWRTVYVHHNETSAIEKTIGFSVTMGRDVREMWGHFIVCLITQPTLQSLAAEKRKCWQRAEWGEVPVPQWYSWCGPRTYQMSAYPKKAALPRTQHLHLGLAWLPVFPRHDHVP